MMPDTDTPTSAADPEPDDGIDEVEDLAQAYDFEENGRKWLRAIASVITAAYGTDSGYDRRAQYALDQLVIAAAERAGRILRSDLGPPD